MSRGKSLVWPLVSVLALGACTSVLGIEDLHEGPRPDGSGGDDGGGKSSSGGSDSAGKMSSGGEPGVDGGSDNGGTATAGADTGGNSGSGGSAVLGGENAGGTEQGMGGEPVTGDSPVKGKVIDRWGLPVANVTMQVGTEQVDTDAQGNFTAEHVPATYDVSLILFEGRAGWVFQGLTRRDPTIQVYSGRASRSGTVEVSFSAKRVAGDMLNIAYGTATGRIEVKDAGTDVAFNNYPEWEGATKTTATAHTLWWTINAMELPTGYKAYDEHPNIMLDADADSTPFQFSLAADNLAPKAITGSAAGTGEDTRKNGVFLRFPSGASITLADHTPATDAFSYLVPTIPGASLTVSAYEGSYYGPLGMVHVDGLQPGAATGALKIPRPPQVLTPPGGTEGITAATSFSFKASPDNAGTFLVIFNRLTSGDPQRLYVVTTQKKFQVPSVVDGALTLTPGAEYEWWVETHGSFTSVDDMAGPKGYVEEFSMNYTEPVATTRSESGSYTYTATYGFTMAP